MNICVMHGRPDALRAAARTEWRRTRRIVRLDLVLFAACCALGMLFAGGAYAQSAPKQPIVLLDRVVAVVNDDVITQNDLDQRMKSVEQQLQQQGTSLPPQAELQKQVLQHMITEKVQLQYAKQTGIKIDDTQLQRAIARIAQDNRLTVDALRGGLAQQGVSWDQFRDRIRNEITLTKLRQRDVNDKVVVTEGEVENYLRMQHEHSGGREEYNLSHILILVPEQASPEQIAQQRKRADAALNEIREGTDFRQVAAAYSDAPDAMQGGALGWRPAGRLPQIFTDALKTMKIGDVSPILRSANGFHIIKLDDKRGQDPVIVEQTHARHILIKPSEVLSDDEARNRLLQIRQRLENGADFAQLARQYSDDASASKGGDLGWVSPGDTVPAFERAMNALQVGQISEPVRTSFGWHLIEVLGRRKMDVSKEREKLLARKAIHQRKADEAGQEWLRQLRDEAYIDIRLDQK
ncbi:MAG TPA: peptidylprolyl isomerase [Burkholderiales bacterium]|nr:peptidylprolyl isomerase [Burkholderiales bacterium]